MFSVDLNRSLNLVSIRDSFGYEPKDSHIFRVVRVLVSKASTFFGTVVAYCHLQDKIVKWNVKFLHFSLDHYRPVGRFPFING